MSEVKQKSAWMWLSGDALRGLSFDRDDGALTWIWQAGCHCADEDEIRQTVEEFQNDGAPALVGPLPEDVAGEIQAALRR